MWEYAVKRRRRVSGACRVAGSAVVSTYIKLTAQPQPTLYTPRRVHSGANLNVCNRLSRLFLIN